MKKLITHMLLIMTLISCMGGGEEAAVPAATPINVNTPILSLYNPVSSPSAYAVAYFLIQNIHPSISGQVHIYNEGVCDQGQKLDSAATNGASSAIVGVIAGIYGVSTLSVDVTVGISRSTCVSINYELIAPSTPTSISLVSPASSPSTDTTPTIKVGNNLLEGHKAKLYTTSNCSNASLIGTSPSATASGNVDITTDSLAVGTYTVYTKVFNEADLEGSCSAVSLSYQLLPPGAGNQLTNGWYPEHLLLGDMNNDGDQDVIVTTGSTIEIFLGLGDGTVQTVKSQADEDGISSPGAITIADFDADGKKDVIHGNSHFLNFFKGIGDGTFNAAVKTALQVGSQYKVADVVAADFDNDGKQDYAAGGAFNSLGALTIYIGNGNGTFQAPANYASDRSLNKLEVADIDGDTDIDILVSSFSGDSLAVFKNNGDGTFAAKVDYASGDGPYNMTIGDIDGDSDVDVIIMNLWDANFSVLLNNGSGVYSAPTTFGTYLGFANYGYGMELGDMNGDTKLDLVFANGREDKYTVFNGVGDGTFGAGADTAAEDEASDVALGDMDGDSNLDIVYTISIPSTNGKIDIDL